MSSVPGKRYALTLQLMLKQFRNRRENKETPQAQIARALTEAAGASPMPLTGTDGGFGMPWAQQYQLQPGEADSIWRGLGLTSNAQAPMWISDQSLGGHSLTENGMNAFLLPNNYLPPVPQIW